MLPNKRPEPNTSITLFLLLLHAAAAAVCYILHNIHDQCVARDTLYYVIWYFKIDDMRHYERVWAIWCLNVWLIKTVYVCD